MALALCLARVTTLYVSGLSIHLMKYRNSPTTALHSSSILSRCFLHAQCIRLTRLSTTVDGLLNFPRGIGSFGSQTP
ncbi:hypothetical protein DL96DRAFT_1595188 [Flagelloscypha sp. PMI_526]|nr:hypothetical protein DL96DRAFT_1595188 [Flagelloscypha sp. PMI_526]